MNATTDKLVDHYTSAFETFEAGLNGHSNEALRQARRAAIEQFARLGFPTSRDEAWKATDLGPLTATAFAPTTDDVTIPDASTVAPYHFGLEGPSLVFINGRFDKSLSTKTFDDGVYLGLIDDVDASLNGYALAALNTAFLIDGARVHVAKGARADQPIHILNLAADTGKPFVAAPRVLVTADDGCQATIVETFAGLAASPYYNNAVTEIHVGENAVVDHVRVILEGSEARHTSTVRVTQDRSSRFTSHTVVIDGAFTRNDISAVLAGEGCESTVNGFYILEGSQYCDNYTLLEHQQPHCPSHELFKGIVQDKARAVFRGKIHVHQAAQKTDAYQQNQNILLSDDARVNTKPQLEIYADDVRCSHGATIGQLDEDALFYLRTRGINRRSAYRILLQAFAEDILNRIQIDSLRDALTERVLAKVDQDRGTS